MKGATDAVLRGLSCLFLAILGSLPANAMTITLHGNTIQVNHYSTSRCRSVSIDEPDNSPQDCNAYCNSGVSEYMFYCNTPGPHTIDAVWVCDDGVIHREHTVVNVAEPAPITCPFVKFETSSMVITHKGDPQDTYQPDYVPEKYRFQTADGQVRVVVKGIRALPPLSMHFKIIDPPSSAPYESTKGSGDNFDKVGGTFAGGSRTAIVPLSSDGPIELQLSTTKWAAGDNYQIIASADPSILTDPDYVCSPQVCSASMPITAWKRIYREEDRMFRKGSFLRSDAYAGSTIARLASVDGIVARTSRKEGTSLMFIHGGPEPHLEPAPGEPPLFVTKIDKKMNQVTLSRPLLRQFVASTTLQSDAVGVVLDGSSEYYTADASLLDGLLYRANVGRGYPPLSAGECRCLPFHVFDPASNLENQALADWWFARSEEPNWFYLAAASRKTGYLGERTPGTRRSWLYIGEVEAQSFINEAALAQEAAAHEGIHAFDTNYGAPAGSGAHCTASEWNNPNRQCLMHGSWRPDGQFYLPQYYDGQVELHWVSGSDPSEYLTIRLHEEPMQ